MNFGIGASAVSQFLLELYVEAQHASPANFTEIALKRLKRFIDFDMALLGLIRPKIEPAWEAPSSERLAGWLCGLRLIHLKGSLPGCPAGIDVAWIHLHNEPAEMVDEWISICANTNVLNRMLASHGQVWTYHVPTDFKEDAALFDFAHRKRHLNILATCNKYGADNLTTAISMRRADAAWKFTEREVELARILLPHFWEAIKINQTVMSARVSSISADTIKGLCICDEAGIIHFQDVAFERLRMSVFQDYQTFRLPPPLIQSFKGNESLWQEGRTAFVCRTVGKLRFITVKVHIGMEKLSKRETEIARFYGTGLTHSEIASELSLSGATVRRHIEAVYRKLNVKNKSDLAFLVNQSQGAAVDKTLAALEALVLNNRQGSHEESGP